MDTDGTLHSLIEVPKDHPAFAGHFPRFPVLPGAVLLDEVLQAIENQRGIDLTQWRITSAKFLGLVRPGDALHLEHEVSKGGSIRFTVSAANRQVASGSLSNAAAPVEPA
jgi:3-hydroxymyristoyl/3-hydroxydecanoyl-(acyl carrier protein) dehydratase